MLIKIIEKEKVAPENRGQSVPKTKKKEVKFTESL